MRPLIRLFLIGLVLGMGHVASAADKSAASPQGWRETNLGWSMTDKLSENGGCGARLASAEIDTLLLLNKDGDIILAGGKPNWEIPPGQHEVTLQIDDTPPVTGNATAFGSVILVLVKDKTMESHLLRAKSILWHLPKGDYHATVHDVPAIVDALRDCEKAHRAQ
jgi:hypothetical protein